jgi:choline-glycine betaine transporter
MTDTRERPSDPAAASRPTGLPIDKTVFGVAAALSVAFVLIGVIWPEGLAEKSTSALGWVTGNFGWLFVITSAAFVLFSAYLALTRYGNIKLGPDDSEPEFSTFSWVSMMFATGMGIGLMFWGVAEPLTHLNAPPLGQAEPGSAEAATLAMQWTFFHWGFHPWAMYAVIGLSIGYFAYRKGFGNLISATFRPLMGDHARKAPGRTIDIVAIFATLFGSATSLGLGALQITGGIDNVFGRGAGSKTLAVAVIAVLTACFVLSAVSGVERGIKYLSNANAIAAGVLVSRTCRRWPSTPASTTARRARGSAAGPSSIGRGGSRGPPSSGCSSPGSRRAARSVSS